MCFHIWKHKSTHRLLSMSDFELKVWALLTQVPKGKVTTYGTLAKAAGNERAARAVGSAMRKNPFAPKVPCHRVVKSDGKIGGFQGKEAQESKEVQKKLDMLKEEGVSFTNGKLTKKQLQKFLFTDFKDPGKVTKEFFENF